MLETATEPGLGERIALIPQLEDPKKLFALLAASRLVAKTADGLEHALG